MPGQWLHRRGPREQNSKFVPKRSLTRSDRREVVNHAAGVCIPSNRIDFHEDEANPRCSPFYSPIPPYGLASAASHTRTSGVHLHYSAPHDIAFMSQVAPGNSARSPRHLGASSHLRNPGGPHQQRRCGRRPWSASECQVNQR